MLSPTITGHTGNDQTEEDSLDSVYKSIELGADAFELDIRRDMEGNLVISHHSRCQEEYNSCHRLSEVFEILRSHHGIRINCDLKEEDLPLDVINLAAGFGVEKDRMILTGIVALPYLEKHSGILKKADIFMNAENILEDVYFNITRQEPSDASRREYYSNPWKHLRSVFSSITPYIGLLTETCQKYGVKGINIPYYFISDENLGDFKKNSISVSVWTVSNEQDIFRFLSQGVDNLTTRQVTVAREIRKKLYGL